MGNNSSEAIPATDASEHCEADINTLPNEVLLEIFERLPPYELSQISLVCKRWYGILNSSWWKCKLFMKYRILKLDSLEEEDLMRRLPPMQLIYDPQDRVLASQIYKLRQYPSFSSTPQLFLHKLNTTMQPFRLIMFGLGMESPATNKITNIILRGRNSTFMVSGLSKGGVKVRYKSHHMLHIATLYTNVKSVRENVNRGAQVCLFSKWLVPDVRPEVRECETPAVSQLQHPLRALIMAADGFVYVSDSTKSQCAAEDEIWMEKSRDCLHLIMKEAELSENTSARRPLLLLSGINKKSNHLSAEIVDGMSLREFNRPWSVCDVDVDYLDGIEHGFNWLLYSIVARK